MTVIPDSVGRRLTGRVPHERIRAVDVPRHDSSLVEQLLALPDLSSAVADAMDEIGVGTVLGTPYCPPSPRGDASAARLSPCATHGPPPIPP